MMPIERVSWPFTPNQGWSNEDLKALNRPEGSDEEDIIVCG